MSKKSNKKGASKQSEKSKNKLLPVAEDPEPWINELKNIVINDENWNCNVSMLVEQSEDVLPYIAAFNDIFSSGKNIRPYIKVLSANSMAIDILEKKFNASINNLSNGYIKLIEEALKYYGPEEFSKDLPVSILASLIKYHIYNLKLKSLAEKEIIEAHKQKVQKLRDESLLAIENLKKPVPVSKEKTKEKKTADKASKKPTASSKKSGKTEKSKEKVQITDKVTTLRKRGEEILDYIETPSDSPSDGPQLYIILNSFFRENLPLELIKLGIPLVSMIRMYNFCKPDESSLIDEEETSVICRGLNTIAKETTLKQRRSSSPANDYLLNQSTINLFWGNFLLILKDKKNVEFFKDMIFVKFYPRLLTELNKKNNTVERFLSIQQSLYRQISHLQYDIQDVIRQHQHFINHLVDRDVVGVFDFKEMNLYTATVESIPPEIINIPFILHCILIQVEHLVDHVPENTDIQVVVDDVEIENETKEDDILESFLDKLDDTHDLFTKEEVAIEKSVQLPTILIHGDEVGLKCYWWSDNDYIQNITLNVLQCFWDQFLYRHLPVFDEVISFDELQDTDLFAMLKQHGKVTVRDRLCNMPCHFHHHSFLPVENKAELFCTDEEELDVSENLVRDPKCYCNDLDSNNYRHYDNPKESHYIGNIYDTHSYCFEEMTSDILLQNLFRCLEYFNCVDTLQDYFKGRYFIKFHHKKTCCNGEYLLGSLKTKTAVRDFYDYTIEEEFQWLHEQELQYNKIERKKEIKKLQTALDKLEYLKNKMAFLTSKVCGEGNFIVQKSLKHGIDEKETLDLAPNFSYTEEERKFSELIFEPTINFESYDIDVPYRVQFTEKQHEFIISEYSKLRIKRLSRLYQNEIISIQASIDDHTLYLHQPLNDTINSDIHLIHKSGIIFYIKKNKIENALIEPLKVSQNLDYTKVEALDNFEPNEYIESDYVFFKPLLYQLSLTLPSTLHLEFVNPNDIALYVKQFYINNNFVPLEIQNEESRCFLTDGKLLKFINDDVVIIYCPNGEMFSCEIDKPKEASLPIPTDVNEKNGTQDPKKKKKDKTEKDIEIPVIEQVLDTIGVTLKSYEHTYATGERVLVIDDKKEVLEPLFLRTYSDIFNGALISERSDGTKLTFNKQGTLFVDFPDGSRITTMASFDVNEISFDTGEELDEIIEPDLNEVSEKNSYSEKGLMKSETDEEYLEDESYINYRYFRRKSKSFVMINIQHSFEHRNYASVSTDFNKEEIKIDLPCNVNFTLSTEGFYRVNLDKNSEFITDYDKLIFREINNKNLPEFIVYFLDKPNPNISDNLVESNTIKPNPEDEKIVNGANVEKHVTIEVNNNDAENNNLIFSCEDSYNNKLTVSREGDIDMQVVDGNDTICKCNRIKNENVFILNTEYNGLEIFPPNQLEVIDEESKKIKNVVVQNFGTVDHNVLLIITPIEENEKDIWSIPLGAVQLHPIFEWPSTYNDEPYSYHPFPKIKRALQPKPVVVPDVLSIRVINRINCNVHLLQESFLQNKNTPDSLRLFKDPALALELYRRGDIPFCKADKAFIEYIKNNVIGSLIARVRMRVVHRLEIRKIKEYIEILVKRLLLPYFDSAQGATFVILFDIIAAAQIQAEGRHKLEKMFYKPLEQLTDDELDFMHDNIAPLTVSQFCNCDEKGAFCQLRILLLAGRTLHGIFPDMITVFFSYGSTVKKKKEAELAVELKTLLLKPTVSLTEDDLTMLHDKLKTKQNVLLCTCPTESQCKLMVILVAGVTLSFIFPNVTSLLKVYNVEINF